MNNESKINLLEQIISLVKQDMTSEDIPIMIGTLLKPQGINGFEPAKIGHPVFEYKGRYLLYLISLSSDHHTKEKYMITIPYNKNTLSPVISFNKT